jgi:hypothetical protein
MKVMHREPGDERAVEHACDGAIAVELTLDVRRCVCNSKFVHASNQQLYERAAVPIVLRRLVFAKHTRCDRTLIE